jgi:hypothetical protein
MRGVVAIIVIDTATHIAPKVLVVIRDEMCKRLWAS